MQNSQKGKIVFGIMAESFIPATRNRNGAGCTGASGINNKNYNNKENEINWNNDKHNNLNFLQRNEMMIPAMTEGGGGGGDNDDSFEKRQSHLRKALAQLYNNSKPDSDDEEYNHNDKDDDDDGQYLLTTMLSPVPSTNNTNSGNNRILHPQVTFTEEEDHEEASSTDTDSSAFSLGDIVDTSTSESSSSSLLLDNSNSAVDNKPTTATSGNRHLTLNNKQYDPPKERLIHPSISFDNTTPTEYSFQNNNNKTKVKVTSSKSTNHSITQNDVNQVVLALQTENNQLQQQIYNIQTTTDYNHNEYQNAAYTIQSLQHELQIIQTERDQLRIQLLDGEKTIHNVLEMKYQARLDNTRREVEIVQKEAEEKVKMMEKENEQLRQLLDEHQKENQSDSNNSHGDSDHKNDETFWKNSFNALVDNLRKLEETGAWQSCSTRMDEIVYQSMNNHHLEIIASEETIGDRLRKLSESSRKKQRDKSIMHNDDDAAVQPIPFGLNVSSQSPHKVEYVSVAVDTEDLKSSISYQTPYMDDGQSNQLVVENESLRGSNDQMRRQLYEYESEVRELKNFKEQILSPINTTDYYHHRDSDTLDHMNKTTCKKLEHENMILSQEKKIFTEEKIILLEESNILAEEKKAVEDENVRLAQTIVELENVAEDATKQCEQLNQRLEETENQLYSLQRTKDDLIVELEKKKEDFQVQEAENRDIFDEMSKEINGLKSSLEALNSSKTTIEGEVGQLKCDKNNLDQVANDLKIEIQRMKAEFHSERQVITMEKERTDEAATEAFAQVQGLKEKLQFLELHSMQLSNDLAASHENIDVLSKENKDLMTESENLSEKLIAMEKQVESLSGSQVDLEDECRRLNNINAMMKAKMETRDCEGESAQTERDELRKKFALLQSSFESVRIENVRLSDSKSDLELKLSQLEDEITMIKRGKTHADNEKEKVALLLSEKDDQMKELKNQVYTLSTENERLDRERKKVKKAIVAYRGGVEQEKDKNNEERNNLQLAVEAGRQEIESLLKEVRNIRSEKDMIQKTATMYRKKIDDLFIEKEKHTIKINELQNALTHLNSISKEKDRFRTKCEDLQKSLDSYRAKVEELVKDKKQIDLHCENQQKTIAVFQVQVDNLVKEREANIQKMNKVMVDYDKSKVENNDLRNALSSCRKEADDLIVEKDKLSCDRDQLDQSLSAMKADLENQKISISAYDKEMKAMIKEKEESDVLIEDLQRSVMAYKDELNRLLCETRMGEAGNNEVVHSKARNSVDGNILSPKDLRGTILAPSTAMSGISTIRSSLFTSGNKASVRQCASSTNSSSIEPIDAMLERIKVMSSRSIRVLEEKRREKKTNSSTRCNEADEEEEDLEETERYVRDVLNRVGTH